MKSWNVFKHIECSKYAAFDCYVYEYGYCVPEHMKSSNTMYSNTLNAVNTQRSKTMYSNMDTTYPNTQKVPTLCNERWGAGVEYHFQEFNEPYAPS